MTSLLPLACKTVAISVSESRDMAVLGLSDLHLSDAMTEIPRHLLALGADVVYGGDLREGGFSQILFELVARHGSGRGRPSVKNFLAWPVHISMPLRRLRAMEQELSGFASLVCLDNEGKEIPSSEWASLEHRPASNNEWTSGLTAMRAEVCRRCHARIVLGGRVDGYKGVMPGIAEEALLSLKAGQPLYVVGGFGGCARDIAESLSLVQRQWLSPRPDWPMRGSFLDYSGESLHNGLTKHESEVLARTPHIDEVVALILRGLTQVFRQTNPPIR